MTGVQTCALPICEYDVQQRLAAFDQITQQASNPVEELMLMMRYLENMFSSINPNLLFDVKRYHPEAWKRYRDFKEEEMMSKIEQNIRKGIDQELYRKDINIKVLARLRVEEVELGFNPEIYPQGKFRISEVQLALFDHFMHGITSIKGHKLINRYKEIHEDDH